MDSCRPKENPSVGGGFSFGRSVVLLRLNGGGQIPDLTAWQFHDSYVAELDSGSVSEQSDVSRGVE